MLCVKLPHREKKVIFKFVPSTLELIKMNAGHMFGVFPYLAINFQWRTWGRRIWWLTASDDLQGTRNYILNLYPVVALLDQISQTLSFFRPHTQFIPQRYGKQRFNSLIVLLIFSVKNLSSHGVILCLNNNAFFFGELFRIALLYVSHFIFRSFWRSSTANIFSSLVMSNRSVELRSTANLFFSLVMSNQSVFLQMEREYMIQQAARPPLSIHDPATGYVAVTLNHFASHLQWN